MKVYSSRKEDAFYLAVWYITWYMGLHLYSCPSSPVALAEGLVGYPAWRHSLTRTLLELSSKHMVKVNVCRAFWLHLVKPHLVSGLRQLHQHLHRPRGASWGYKSCHRLLLFYSCAGFSDLSNPGDLPVPPTAADWVPTGVSVLPVFSCCSCLKNLRDPFYYAIMCVNGIICVQLSNLPFQRHVDISKELCWSVSSNHEN